MNAGAVRRSGCRAAACRQSPRDRRCRTAPSRAALVPDRPPRSTGKHNGRWHDMAPGRGRSRTRPALSASAGDPSERSPSDRSHPTTSPPAKSRQSPPASTAAPSTSGDPAPAQADPTADPSFPPGASHLRESRCGPPGTSSARRWLAIAQPTTRRLQTSTTTAR